MESVLVQASLQGAAEGAAEAVGADDSSGTSDAQTAEAAEAAAAASTEDTVSSSSTGENTNMNDSAAVEICELTSGGATQRSRGPRRRGGPLG